MATGAAAAGFGAGATAFGNGAGLATTGGGVTEIPRLLLLLEFPAEPDPYVEFI